MRSVGTRCYVQLFLADEDNPLFLQTKEARRSVLEFSRGKSHKSDRHEILPHSAKRIENGQSRGSPRLDSHR